MKINKRIVGTEAELPMPSMFIRQALAFNQMMRVLIDQWFTFQAMCPADNIQMEEVIKAMDAVSNEIHGVILDLGMNEDATDDAYVRGYNKLMSSGGFVPPTILKTFIDLYADAKRKKGSL